MPFRPRACRTIRSRRSSAPTKSCSPGSATTPRAGRRTNANPEGRMANAWLQVEHPIYHERKIEWQINERRFRAGMDVLQELRRFDWEAGLDITGKSTRSQELAVQTAVEKEIAAGGKYN